jgi:hypothetical protein
MQVLKHLVVRRESYRPTWKLCALVLVAVPLAVILTRGLWVPRIPRDLTCAKDIAPSGALLVENFDPEYSLFLEAAELQRAGIAQRVLIPVEIARGLTAPDAIETGVAELMAGTAGVQNPEFVPVNQVEPISLNAARQIRDFLHHEKVDSVLVIAPGFRSRRSALVYGSVLEPGGIQVRCDPVFVEPPEEWIETWHGIQDVFLQWGKLRYYQFWVLL